MATVRCPTCHRQAPVEGGIMQPHLTSVSTAGERQCAGVGKRVSSAEIHLLTFYVNPDSAEMSELADELLRAGRLHDVCIGRGYPRFCAMHFPSIEAAQTWADLHEGEICEVQTCTLGMQGT